MIVWNGISSDDVGVVVEHYPRIIIPKRKIEVIQVPGRNGDIIIDHESYENYEQEYHVFLDAKHYGGLEVVIPKLSEWLYSSIGYQKLEDSYFPEYYRMAYVANAYEFSSWFNIYGEGSLKFNCAPEKHYKIGDQEIEIINGQTIHNPSGLPSSPLITFSCSGSNDGEIIFTVDGVQKKLTFSSNIASPGTCVIDVKMHTASSGWDLVGLYENLKLGKDTTITWVGNISTFKIIPRWYTI